MISQPHPASLNHHTINVNSSGQWKRPRDEEQAMEHDESSWQCFPKRAKVTRGRETGSPSPLHRQQQNGFSTHALYGAPATAPVSETGYHQQLKQPQCQQKQQSAGQRSCERQSPLPEETQYQNMNSLLGSLHLARRRQRGSESREPQLPAQQVSSPNIDSTGFRSNRPHQGSRHRAVSLRVDSKLY